MSTALDGTFSMPSFATIGDPYKGPALHGSVHTSKDERKWLAASGVKKGQTGDNWGVGVREFQRLSEKEPYKEAFRGELDVRMAGRAKFRSEFGFKFANPMKVSSCSGDYYGAIGEPHEHFDQGDYGKRGVRDKIEEIAPRNVLTSPMKSGSYGTLGTKIGQFEYPYAVEGKPADVYDQDRLTRTEERLGHYASIGDRKAFKSMTHAVDMFDAQEHTCASQVYTRDDKCLQAPAPDNESMTKKERIEAEADGVLKEGYKAFVPNSFKKEGEQGFFEKFTEYSPEVFDERLKRRTVLPQRHHPVKEVMEMMGMSEAMIERKAFKPNSFPKTRFTPGKELNGINAHTLDRYT
jgi:hypothetical protein